MKKITLKGRIKRYLERNNSWHASGDIEQLAVRNGYTGSTATRMLRLLVEEEVLEVDYRGKRGHSHYRAVNNKPVVIGYLDEERDVYVIPNTKAKLD